MPFAPPARPRLAGYLAALLSLPAVALAQEWPAGAPITIVMGFPAGSGVDVVARTLQEPLEQALGAKIVTDYRTGAGGNLASERSRERAPTATPCSSARLRLTA